MKKAVLIILCLLLSGCATSQMFTVPPEEFSQQVKTLGVLPILIDVETIDYYSQNELVALLHLYTTAVQESLVDKLRKQGRYFDVRPIEGDPQQIRTRLLAGHSMVGEAATSQREYTFIPQGSAEFADEAVADAVLVVVVHGINRQEKRWSSHSLRMEYLSADYSSLLYTAAIVDPTGRVLWNLHMPADEVMLRLDYPDFTEAYWNRNESVRIKSISLDGLRRTLQEPDSAMMVDKDMPRPFNQMIDRIISTMK